MKEALFYKPETKGKVRCGLCNHRCLIEDGRRGICSVRENRGGKLYSLVYGKLVSENVDPIEKKTFVSLPFGFYVLLHFHGRVQFPLSALSKLPNFPVSSSL